MQRQLAVNRLSGLQMSYSVSGFIPGEFPYDSSVYGLAKLIDAAVVSLEPMQLVTDPPYQRHRVWM